MLRARYVFNCRFNLMRVRNGWWNARGLPLQARAARLIATVGRYEYRAASKATVGLLGLEIGPPRPPLVPLGADTLSKLRAELEEQGLPVAARGA